MNKSVSIIICSCRKSERLISTLQSIYVAEIPTDVSVEILLVDNSASGEISVMRVFNENSSIQIRHLRMIESGKARSLNHAIRASASNILLFTDDDVLVPKEWIRLMIEPILSGRRDAVVGSIRIKQSLERPWMTAIHRAWMASTESLNRERPEALIGANMAIGKHVFEKIPEFDSELGPGSWVGSGEESLFSLQMHQAGFEIGSVFDACVEHDFDPARLSRRQLLRRAKIEGRVAAYICHHWHHTPVVAPLFQLLKPLTKLLILKILNLYSREDFARERELQTVAKISFILFFVNHKNKSRNYEVKGLKKLRR